MEDTPRRVVVIGLGGTIAMGPAAVEASAEVDGARSAGVVPLLSADQLVAAVPGLDAAGVEVVVDDLRSLPGASLGFDDLRAVAAAVERHLGAGAAGVVVTQGTDTIEESAWFLDLLHGRDEPVVVTGAMRNPTLAGADGPANLLAAVRVAAGDAARGQGCVVVFADEIHAARRVRKTHSSSIGTFRSPDGGPLGYVAAGRPHLVNRLPDRVVLPMPDGPWPRVPLVAMTLGDDGTLLDAIAAASSAAASSAAASSAAAGTSPASSAAAGTSPASSAAAGSAAAGPSTAGSGTAGSGAAGSGADGLVVAGFGVGHVPAHLADRLTELAARIPVVLASRTGAGPALPSGYGFTGSETHLLAGGLISAGFLDPYKARILLTLLLASRSVFDPPEGSVGSKTEQLRIRRTFATAGGYASG
jgi:L-asparaginase